MAEQRTEKRMGCMSSILHIFHRKQIILARKRIHSTSPPIIVGASPETTSYCESESERPNVVLTSPENDNGGSPSVVARLELPSYNQKTKQMVNIKLDSKYIGCNNFQVKQPNQSQSHSHIVERIVRDDLKSCKTSPRNQTTFTMDEQFNDLNELKQILQVLQLKGLLPSTNRDSGPVDRNHRIPTTVAATSPNRIDSNLKSCCNSIIKRKPLSIEIQTRYIETSTTSSSSSSPIDSPTVTPGSVHHSITNQTPRNNSFIKNVVIDNKESSSISKGTTIKSASTTNSEISENFRDGKRLLERCCKLLHSIEEMNSATESPTPSSAAVLPSPVSVLDKDESSSPSHSIDFKVSPAVDFDEDNWTTQIPPKEHDEHEEFMSDDSDFIYISKILRASQHLQDYSTDFLSIEKQFYDSKITSDDSKISNCHRKLVFDVIIEILDRNRQLPSWKASVRDSGTSVKQIWNEFQKTRKLIINTGDGIDLLELITGVLKKEVQIKDWDDYPMEKSEVILDVERLIFKDLVSESIGDLVEFSGQCMFSRTRRRLVF